MTRKEANAVMRNKYGPDWYDHPEGRARRDALMHSGVKSKAAARARKGTAPRPRGLLHWQYGPMILTESFMLALNRHLAHSFRSDGHLRGRVGGRRYRGKKEVPRIVEAKKPRLNVLLYNQYGQKEFTIDHKTGQVHRTHASGGKGFPYGTVDEISERGQVIVFDSD